MGKGMGALYAIAALLELTLPVRIHPRLRVRPVPGEL